MNYIIIRPTLLLLIPWLPNLITISISSVEGGELFDKVVSCGKFQENVAKMLFYQMLSACKVRFN